MPGQKKTAATIADLPTAKDFLDALEELTGQQRKFVFAVIDGKSLAQAYRENYNVTNPEAEWIRLEACRVAAYPSVSHAIRCGIMAGMGSAVATLEDHSAELRRLRDHALETGNVGAAVLAETNRGKVSKLYSDQIDLNIHKMDDTAMIEQIRAKFGDEAADKAEKKLRGE